MKLVAAKINLNSAIYLLLRKFLQIKTAVTLKGGNFYD